MYKIMEVVKMTVILIILGIILGILGIIVGVLLIIKFFKWMLSNVS